MQDKDGNSPLHLAIFQGYINILELFIENKDKFYLNLMNNDGNTPLHLAVSLLGRINVVEELIKARVKLNEENKDGNTPLHLAVINRNLEAVEILLNAGTKIITTNKHRKTLLMSIIDSISEIDIHSMTTVSPWQTQIENPDFNKIMGLLIDKGADINIINNDDEEESEEEEECDENEEEEEDTEESEGKNEEEKKRTLIDYAKDKGYEPIVDFLQAKLTEKID